MYDELVKRLRTSVDGRYEKCDGCPYEEDYPCCVDCLDKMHKQAADAIEELSKPRWIPVTERLPELNENVLVYSAHSGLIRIDANIWFDRNATHWMPLPSTEGLNET